MTRKRQIIFDCIKESSNPLSAAQIHESSGSEMDLATIYRGLQFLEEKQFITSFIFSCDERGMERYYIYSQIEHSHFMHCRKCHHFFPIPLCPLKAVENLEEKLNGFLVEDHTITMKGLCRSCQ